MALLSEVMYSSQPDESTRTGSEALAVVTIIFFPFDAFGGAAEFFYGTRTVQVNGAVENVDLKLQTRRKRKLLPNLFRYDDLKFWGNLDSFHRPPYDRYYRYELRMSKSYLVLRSVVSMVPAEDDSR